MNVTKTADVVKNPRLVHARRRRDWFLRPELLREKVSRRAVREVYQIFRREGEGCCRAEEEEEENLKIEILKHDFDEHFALRSGMSKQQQQQQHSKRKFREGERGFRVERELRAESAFYFVR